METTTQRTYLLMVMQIEEIGERAERGSILMDQYRPDWFDNDVLNLQIFSMTSGDSCVIGQAVRSEDVKGGFEYPPGYSLKVDWMEETYNGVPEGGDFEIYYGFCLTNRYNEDDLIWQDWHWDELQRAWKVQINARRLVKKIMAVTG